MTSLVQPARVLLNPFDAMGTAVEARRWVWPLLLLALCATASGTATALRWNAATAVVQETQERGQGERMTESELAEEIQMASRRMLMKGIAQGVFLSPLHVLLLAAALWFVGWLFDARASFESLMAVASLALLPLALYHLLLTACVLWQHSITLEQARELVPSSLAALDGLSPRLRQLLKAVDFFHLWSVVLLGVGFSAATGMRRGRSLLLAGGLYVMFAGVVLIGLPGLMRMQGGGH